MESFRVNGLRDPIVSKDKWAEYAKEFMADTKLGCS